MKAGDIQDFTLEISSLEIFEQYLGFTLEACGVRCIEEKGYKIGNLAWEYPSEPVWQEMDDTRLAGYPELYWPVCRLSDRGQFTGSREFDDKNNLAGEVMALLERADKHAYLAASNTLLADVEGLSGVGYRLHVSGYSGITGQ